MAVVNEFVGRQSPLRRVGAKRFGDLRVVCQVVQAAEEIVLVPLLDAGASFVIGFGVSLGAARQVAPVAVVLVVGPRLALAGGVHVGEACDAEFADSSAVAAPGLGVVVLGLGERDALSGVG